MRLIMKKIIKLLIITYCCVFAFGCASKNKDNAWQNRNLRQAYQYHENDVRANQQILKTAESAIGTPYVRGGSQPGGFDCSGLVSWAYNSIGVKVPRTAREQSVIGEHIKNQEDMRAGDIVAFRHPKRGYHTGIYIGDGKFIHSPRKKSTVRINSLDDPYFSETLLGARRINFTADENLLAQAESRLANEPKISKRNKSKKIENKRSKSKKSEIALNKNKKNKQSLNAKNNKKSVKQTPNKKKSSNKIASNTSKNKKNKSSNRS